MTCEIKTSLGWKTDQALSGLLHNGVVILENGNMHIEIATGGLNSPTKVYITGQKPIDLVTEGKVKPWSSVSVRLGLNMYSNGASVSFLDPEDPYYFKVTNLPKGNV